MDIFTKRRLKRTEKQAKSTRSTNKTAVVMDTALFDALRRCRLDLAKRDRVRPYNVASDQMLREIVDQQPTTLIELSQINGMGPRRLERYGAALMKILPDTHNLGVGLGTSCTVEFPLWWCLPASHEHCRFHTVQ